MKRGRDIGVPVELQVQVYSFFDVLVKKDRSILRQLNFEGDALVQVYRNLFGTDYLNTSGFEECRHMEEWIVGQMFYETLDALDDLKTMALRACALPTCYSKVKEFVRDYLIGFGQEVLLQRLLENEIEWDGSYMLDVEFHMSWACKLGLVKVPESLVSRYYGYILGSCDEYLECASVPLNDCWPKSWSHKIKPASYYLLKAGRMDLLERLMPIFRYPSAELATAMVHLRYTPRVVNEMEKLLDKYFNLGDISHRFREVVTRLCAPLWPYTRLVMKCGFEISEEALDSVFNNCNSFNPIMELDRHNYFKGAEVHPLLRQNSFMFGVKQALAAAEHRWNVEYKPEKHHPPGWTLRDAILEQMAGHADMFMQKDGTLYVHHETTIGFLESHGEEIQERVLKIDTGNLPRLRKYFESKCLSSV